MSNRRRKRSARNLVRHIAAVLLACGAAPPCGLSQPAGRLVEHVIDGFSGFALLQDLRGYIWCGTGQGLLRYDGQSAVFLRSDEDDPSTLSANHVNSLALGLDGSIWVGTSAGLDRLDPVTRKVRRFELPSSGKRPDGRTSVTALLADSSGTVWVGTQEDGLFEVRVMHIQGRDSLVVTSHRHRAGDPRSLSHDHVHALGVDPAGQGGCILVGTSDGLNRLHVANGACERYHHDPRDTTSLPHDEVWAIIAGEAGDVWMGTGSGVCRMPAWGASRFERLLPEGQGPVFTLAFDAQGFLWFGTHASTVVRYDPHSGLAQKQSIEQEFYGRRYVNGVYSSLRDRWGSVWFGVHYGLERYDPARKRFEFVSLPPSPDRWVVNTTAFCEDDRRNIWIATDALGTYRFDPASSDTVRFSHQEGDPASLCWDEVTAIVKDRSGTLWFGTSNGLDRYDPVTESFEHIRSAAPDGPDSRSLPGRCVYDLLVETGGRIWVATEGGLSLLDPSTRRFAHFLGPAQMEELGSFIGDVIQPASWSDGSLLIGSRGLYRFSPTRGTIVRYRHGSGAAETDMSQMVFGLLGDRSGTIWVSAYSGLYLLRPDGSIHHLRVPGQTTAELVCPAVQDGEGDVWAGTATSGVLRSGPEGQMLRRYDVKGGFLKNNFCLRGAFSSSDGTVYLGAPNGFLRFHPSQVADNPVVPDVHITAVHVLDRPVAFVDTAQVRFHHGDNFIRFEFIGLCYTDPEKIQYAYRLEGLSDEWLHCGTERLASFTNLDPGTYVFRVKASNGDGLWNAQGASLRFVIDSPYWQTWWFRAASAILVAALAYGAYRFRIARMVALERLRLRIANDLHDDIGSDLSALALESDLLARRMSDGDPGRERLRAVGGTIRKAADNLRDVVWIVSPDRDSVCDLAERMREVASKLPPDLVCEFRCEGKAPSAALHLEFKRHILMMFKEIMHNVASHSRASRVEVDLDLDRTRLRLCVQDNGIGFDPSAHHGGRGLRSLRARAAAIGGTLTIDSSHGRGTLICLEAHIARL